MENSDYRPLPPPRNNVSSKSIKRKPPVPQPRMHININNSVLKDGSSSTSSAFKDLNVFLKKHIKPEVKMATEIVERKTERKRSVIENTRSMSICIEKSFRSLLPRPARRHTISQTSEDFKPDICESPFDNDIFSSLSFDSPIPSDSNSDRSFSNYYSESDFCSSQPPNFPPPPLPQNILYDKIPSSSNSSSQCGSYSTENIYEFISIGQTKSQSNSYENWIPTNERSFSSSDISIVNSETKCRKSDSHEKTCLKLLNNEDTKSVILQFDPLNNTYDNLSNKQKEDNTEEECLLLQEIDEILYPSHYSTIDLSVMNYSLENLDDDLYNIPEPPERVDSIDNSSSPVLLYTNNENIIDIKEKNHDEPIIEEKPRKNSLKNWLSMKRTSKKVSDGLPCSVGKIKSILKPEDNVEINGSVEIEQSSIFHNGILFVSMDEKHKDFEKKWCQIAGGQLKCSVNKNVMENTILLTSLLSIQMVNEHKQM